MVEPLIQYDWEPYVKTERQGKCHVITKVEISYAVANQGTPQNASKPQEEARKNFPIGFRESTIL